MTTIAKRLYTFVSRLLGGPPPFRIHAWDGSTAGSGEITLRVRDENALRRLLWRPNELGLARAYITGEIDVDGDLTRGLSDLWRLAARRSARIGPGTLLAGARLASRLGALGGPPPASHLEAGLSGRLHSRHRDRAAISHHYDLSNDFYAKLLDPTMSYSCGYWTRDDPGYGLTEAQTDKLDLICRKLGLTEGTRHLDVGCGWGALGLHAAARYGAVVTGVTLSREQHRFASRRAEELGLTDRVTFQLRDYRDIDDGPFDTITSIEMGEHVGRRRYPAFAARLRRLLRPRGRLLLQQMSRSGNAPGGGAFIETYIAPDMHMRPMGETVALLERAGLEVRDVEALREHYVRTVAAWADTLEARWDEFVAEFGEPTARVWRLYLAGGALAFTEGRMGVDQILAVAPADSGASGMPPTRDAALGDRETVNLCPIRCGSTSRPRPVPRSPSC